jgi:uridine phosphorylase
MPDRDTTPLLDHPLDQPTAFAPEALVEAVRNERGLPRTGVPPVCILEFDGDLTDWIAKTGKSKPCEAWACFHTAMEEIDVDGLRAGIVARTIGGPYAVLVAEQLLASGARAILGLTSAGRVSPAAPLPSLVVATRALRDEGASLHYLPPSRFVDAPAAVVDALTAGLEGVGQPVTAGAVWTTDAPYRETAGQLARHAREGILAVEMQAASLFALAQAKQARIGVVAHISNATDNEGEDFDKGGHELGYEIVRRMVRAVYRLI